MPDRPTADPMQAMMKAVREVNESRVCESPDVVCAMGSPFRGNKMCIRDRYFLAPSADKA